MDEYPKNDEQFDDFFATEQDCFEYLISIRWPDGPLCPKCKSDKFWHSNNGQILQCSACRQKIEATGWYYFSGHPHSSEKIVQSSLVDYVPKVRK
jgi:ribosomal protein L37AE/L43A